MAGMSFDEAYNALMSPTPYAHSTAAAMMRNFGAAAQTMAAGLRDGGTTANDNAGSSGAATQEQAELRAKWFDQVAQNSNVAATKMQALADQGNQHQTTAATTMATYQQAVTADNQSQGAQDMAVIHHMQSGSTTMNGAVDDWSQSYSSLSMPAPPPVPHTGGSSTGGSTPHSGSSDYPGGTSGGSTNTSGSSTSTTGGTSLETTTSGSTDAGWVGNPIFDPPPNVTGVTVPSSGGDFAGWFHDPHTGYYVDPSTGREFDPVTSRWVDPVTGQPFGDVTQYATSLQGLGGASTSGGLLADTGSSVGTGAGGFSALFGGGNTAAVAASYGGMVPPSLATGSRGIGSLWQQAGSSTAVKQQVASEMLAREEAARTGRPYMPSTQAGGGGAGAGAAGGRNRPGYLTAAEEESALFSSGGRTGLRSSGGEGMSEEGSLFGTRTGVRGSGAMAEGEESMAGGAGGGRGAGAGATEGAGAAGGRRSYLPPNQAGTGKDDKHKRADRPDWLIDDDVFAPDDAPTGILGD